MTGCYNSRVKARKCTSLPL